MEQLEQLLGDDATESLRARWAEELCWAHQEHLLFDDRPGALVLEQRIAAELSERPPRDSGFVLRQHLAWAQVCLEAARHRVAAGDDEGARSEIPFMLVRAEAVTGDAEGMRIHADALELAHGFMRRSGERAMARVLLGRLRALAMCSGDRAVREPLARALGVAVVAELDDEPSRARTIAVELRAQAGRPLASEPERTALGEALLVLHEWADPFEQASIEQELAELANRPGAAHEQHRAWSQAVGRAPREGRRTLRPPLDQLRARAYRSPDFEDLGALFRRLEDELPNFAGDFQEHISVFNEMRCIAERPGADVALRLRFARLWLLQSFDARRYDFGAVANDRWAYTWAQEAADRGDVEGQVLLARCLSSGRGTDPDRAAAAEVLRDAVARGSDEAELLLRVLGAERFPWLRHRYALMTWGGLAMLVVYLVTQPVRFDPWGVVAYLAIALGLMLISGLWSTLVSWWASRGEDDASGDDADGDDDAEEDEPVHGSNYLADHLFDGFVRRPWRLVKVATEDGFVMAPLCLLGINPISAAVAGLVFGLAHYPTYPGRACIYKGINYTLVALLVVPWAGLWPIVVGHVLWDAGLLYLWRWLRSSDE